MSYRLNPLTGQLDFFQLVGTAESAFWLESAARLSSVGLAGFFEDFNRLDASGFPLFGTSDFVISGSAFSVTPTNSTVGLVGAGYPKWTVQLGPGVSRQNTVGTGPLAGQFWRFKARFRSTIASPNFKMYLSRAAGSESVGFGVVSLGLGYLYGNFNVLTQEPSAAQFSAVATALGTTMHTFEMYCVGDGIVNLSLDGGHSFAAPLPNSGATGTPFFSVFSTGLELDYVGLAVRRA